MENFTFTWLSGLKLFAGLLLFGVWLIARQQGALDKKNQKAREAAQLEGRPLPARRIVNRSNRIIVIVALVFIIVVLSLGNKSTL